MSTWIKEEDTRSWIQRLITTVLKKGPVPRHVGFILDGNRRYAKEKHLDSVEGHRQGFTKLAETLRWCLDFGITEVTVYVFSIENFKRPPDEVTDLMNLAREKFIKLLEEEEKIMEQGVCIQIVGDWSLVPDDLRPLFAKAMTLTRYNIKAKLNVAFAYTSRNEITRGLQAVEKGVLAKDLKVEDVSTSLLEEAFQLLPMKPLDLLVRTSGETRLSDFLLWQSTDTILCFADVLWPDFSYWHLIKAVFHFQTNQMSLQQFNYSSRHLTYTTESEADIRRGHFLEKYRDEMWRKLEEDASKCPLFSTIS